MAVIQFRQLSLAEAEQCVAEIWTCLEEYHIPTPTLSFEFRDSFRTSIRMNIDDCIAANTMVGRLSTWIETKRSRSIVDRGPRLQAYTQSPVTGAGRAAAPLSLVAITAPTGPSYASSRFRRK